MRVSKSTRCISLAVALWAGSACLTHALELQIEPGKEEGEVVVHLQSSQKEYDAAKGLVGSGKAIVDSRIPGANEVNLRLPMTTEKYNGLRKQAVDKEGTGPLWCATCTAGDGKKSTEIKARNSLAAALIGTSGCEEATKSQNIKVTGPGPCAKQ